MAQAPPSSLLIIRNVMMNASYDAYSSSSLFAKFAVRLIFHPSDLSDFRFQSDKSVSRETFWYD